MFTAAVRAAWEEYWCQRGQVVTTFFDREPVWAANQDVANLWAEIESRLLGSGYVPTPGGYIGSFRWCPVGIGGKTCKPNGTNCSLHNYSLALDVEYQYNFHIHSRVTLEDFEEDWWTSVCKFTPENIAAVESIRNTYGEQMIRWLGWSIGDTMHLQVNVPPDRMTIAGEDMIEKIEDETWIALGRAGGFDGSYYTRTGDANGASVYDEAFPQQSMWHAYNVGLQGTVIAALVPVQGPPPGVEVEKVEVIKEVRIV